MSILLPLTWWSQWTLLCTLPGWWATFVGTCCGVVAHVPMLDNSSQQRVQVFSIVIAGLEA